MTSELSEADTRLAYIDPVLNELGYELTESVKQDFVRLEHKKKDYVIFPKGEAYGTPLLLIEAKKFSIEIKLKDGFADISDSTTKSIIDQSFKYGEEAGIPWILTSNGRQWILFKTYIPGVKKHERVFLAFKSEEDLKNRWRELVSFIGLDKTLDIPQRFNKLETQLSDKTMLFTLPEESTNVIVDTLKSIYKTLYEKAKAKDLKLVEQTLQRRGMSGKELKHRACMRMLHKLLFINILESFHIQRNILSSWGMKNYERLGYTSPVSKLVNDVLSDFNQKFNGTLFQEKHAWDVYSWEDEILRTAILELDKIDYSMINRDIIGDIYEHFLGEIVKEEEDINIRKILGQYYTPNYVVDYIVRNTLEPFLKNYKGDLRKIKILDPACGSGSFLIRCYEILKKEYERRNEERKKIAQNKEGLDLFLGEYDPINDPLKHNLYGVDVNPDAIQLAELNLNLQKMISDEYLRYIEPEMIKREHRLFPLNNLKCGNSLISDVNVVGESAFSWEESFPEVFSGKDEKTGFDIVIGNPPYVNVENLKDVERTYLMTNYAVCIKRVDIFVPFIDKGLSLLKEGGKLSYIVSYAFLSQDFGEKMRKKLLDSTLIEEIVNLRKFKIFPEAMVRNAIFRIVKLEEPNAEEKAHSNKIKIIVQTEHPKEASGIKGIEYQTNQSLYLETPEYMFRTELNDETLKIVKKIDERSLQLGKILCVSWGARGIPVEEFHLDQPIKGYEHLCKKMIKGENIDKYQLKYEGKWLLYDPDAECHPKGLYRPAFQELFESPKLIVAEVTGPKGLVATYDEQGFYTDHSLSCAISKFRLEGKDKDFFGKHKIAISDEDIRVSREYYLKYILGVLNSTTISFYFQTMLGYELNVYPELVEKLPIPKANENQQKEIIENVETILELNRCQLVVEDVFDGLLRKYGFSSSKPLFYYYPQHPTEVEIDVVNSQNFDEPEELPKLYTTLSSNFIIITDDNKNPLYKICFSNNVMQQFFFLAIKRFLKTTKKKKFNDATKTIEIPIYANNKESNAQQICSLMETLLAWHQNALKNELRDCPVKTLDLEKFEKMKEAIDGEINKKIFDLLELDIEDIKIVERVRDP
jgi:type I restriction-modification system DNA methylase subunit/predicted type IV restriction endonuclease